MKTVKERFSNIEKIGLEKDWFEDLYHQILTMSWMRFILTYVVFFLIFNLFFGILYWLESSSVNGSNGNFFLDFSFSVQTFSTIGYGVFSPATTYAHSIVIIESIFSVLLTALLTGLAFAKFARPFARIQFSDFILITQYNGKRTLLLRLANLRGNQIAEATIKAVALMSETTQEGISMRLQKDLNFVRNTSSFFILSWTVLHIIDETSPLYNLTAEDIKKQNIEISISVIGHDESFSQSVHASCVYGPDDIVFNKQFVDIITASENGKAARIDYSKFNMLRD